MRTEHAGIEQSRVLYEYGAVRSCSDDRNHFQVQVDKDSGAPTYFQILQRTNSFTMLSISREPDPRCKSADLMRKR